MKDEVYLRTKKIQELEKRMKFVEENSIAGLRDFFATSALSILANPALFIDNIFSDKVAERAYAIADAMLIEREKKNK